MGIVRRYRTAITRHHRSAGFGIHSPHAFNFVTNVLRCRLPYYAYDDIAALRQAVIKESASRWPHPRIISFKNAKLLFRVVNHFNPMEMLQIGTCYGVSSACLLAVDSHSHITLYEPHLGSYAPIEKVLEAYGERIGCHDSLSGAIAAYRARAGREQQFVLINDLPCGASDYAALQAMLHEMLRGKCVVVMRGLARNDLINRLWLECRQWLPAGQTFTNEKIAVIVATPKLQREDFFLWF